MSVVDVDVGVGVGVGGKGERERPPAGVLWVGGGMGVEGVATRS